MDCILSGTSVHEILQSRILEWVAIPFSKFQGKYVAKKPHALLIGHWAFSTLKQSQEPIGHGLLGWYDPPTKNRSQFLEMTLGTSLEFQLRICVPMQGTWL